MPKSNTLQAVERLVFLVNNGHVEPLKHALEDFERGGLRKEKLINYPVQRYNGRTAVHLAASSGLLDCLGLLLKSGGKFVVLIYFFPSFICTGLVLFPAHDFTCIYLLHVCV